MTHDFQPETGRYQHTSSYHNCAIKVTVDKDGAFITKLAGDTPIATVAMTRLQACEVTRLLSHGLDQTSGVLSYGESQRRHLCPYCGAIGDPYRTYAPEIERDFNAYRCQGGPYHIFYVEKRLESLPQLPDQGELTGNEKRPVASSHAVTVQLRSELTFTLSTLDEQEALNAYNEASASYRNGQIMCAELFKDGQLAASTDHARDAEAIRLWSGDKEGRHNAYQC